jgi:hypothetical protein
MTLALQLPLRPALPNIYGPVNFREQREIFRRIDQMLRVSGVDMDLVSGSLESRGIKPTARKVAWMLSGIRCAILRRLMGLSLRKFEIRLADSSHMQWFAHCGDYGQIPPCSKSSLDRFEKTYDLSDLENVVDELTHQAMSVEDAKRLGELTQPLDMGDIFADCTCVKANIHFPVDWVLLVDSVRTLMKAVRLIREQGIKHRMPEPEHFLKRINTLAMAMSGSRRKPESKKARKKVVRQMKALNRVVAKHAERYYDLLDVDWEQTDWTRKQTEQVLRRIESVLKQLPDAIHQAHERIIGERKVENKDKILSLYEPDVHVLVRGKSGAEVEFGNKLYIAEQRDGVLVDWKLFKDHVPSDSTLVQQSLERMELTEVGLPEGYVTDRGFPSKPNVAWLQKNGIRDGMCAKSPDENRERRQDPWYSEVQKRRSGTEARIGIFKHVFLRGVMKEKGFENRNRALIWSVLSHNLWVLARKSLSDEAERLEAAA